MAAVLLRALGGRLRGRVALSKQQLIRKRAIRFSVHVDQFSGRTLFVLQLRGSAVPWWTNETFWIPSLVCIAANNPWTRVGIFLALSAIVIKGRRQLTKHALSNFPKGFFFFDNSRSCPFASSTCHPHDHKTTKFREGPRLRSLRCF